MKNISTLRLGLFLKGLAMGIAEIIPGVSGGTIAFITGIYEELLNTIKGFNFSLIKTLRKEGIGSFWKAINGNFLVMLLGGMFIGIVVGIFLIGYLIEYYQAPLWAFFFGLIISSAIYIGRQITNWNSWSIAFVLFGFIIAFGITLLSPSEGTNNYVVLLFSGMLAICAMILPGISGSFILLLLGMYTIVRGEAENALKTFEVDSLLSIGFFAIGCILGLALFSRLLSFTFKNYKNQTLSVLLGFMLGSLNKIWPWRNPVSWLNKETGIIENDVTSLTKEVLLGDNIQLIREVKVMPKDYLFFESQFWICILTFLIGLAIVLYLDHIDRSSKKG